ncbi:hypothetical protein E0Z10_g9267 [Xylaria hypoxylon]|uniref:Glycosyltransferase 2-like domain-containing protein n=1 Tax=Xylaria hypoxylon TaxID=37992 RepID=A0A4Z0YLH1_9PEZI|nr:hypothetical protein E0Z10_g9267 [Xylaria hypoxylon]
MSAAELFLIENLLWELAERQLAIPTVGYDPSSFPRALISWLANKPREIIVVTVSSEKQKARTLLNSEPIRAANTGTEILLLSIPLPNKRDQIVHGIQACTGRIVGLVDDDAFWNPHTLIHLLAPFQEPDIGLVGGPIESYIPDERKDSSVITAWEVAALRNRSKRRGGNKLFYARDGSTNFTVSGATMLLRAAVVKDPVFQTEFTDEKFLGVRMNTGDDSFITRFILFQHLSEGRQGGRKWRLGMQITPEATVTTSLIPDSRFADQMKRWLRTGLRFRLICLFREPGLRNFWRTTPYMCKKMAEGLYNPFLNIIWYVCFFKVVHQRPLLASLIMLYYLYGLVISILAFAREFPYARRHIWAAFIIDRVSLISDFYCWSTLAQESWTSRKGVDGIDM